MPDNVYLTTKIKRGHEYLYLEGRAWIDGRCRRTWQRYLGPKDQIVGQELPTFTRKEVIATDTKVYEFGLSAALIAITRELDLSSIIDEVLHRYHIESATMSRDLIIATINRGVAPCSKTKMKKWFAKDWISTQYPLKPSTLNASTYWNQFQLLTPEILQDIHLAIVRKIQEQYTLDTSSLFYDATNFFTYDQEHSNATLSQFGHCKEGRHSNRIVGLNLLATRTYGIPLLYQTYPGNIQDAKSFRDAFKAIDARLAALSLNPHDVTLTFDKGNLSSEAFKRIDKKKIGYITSLRNSTQKDLIALPRDQFTSITLPITQKHVEYCWTTQFIYSKDRLVYVILDPAKQAHQSHLFEKRLQKRKQAIEKYFQTRLNIKMWTKKDVVETKVKKMIGKKPFAAIIIPRIMEEQGQISLALDIDMQAQETFESTLGRTILCTNRETWTPEEVIWGYRQQYLVEHDFHYMKAPGLIAIRPMRHWCNPSMHAHVFTCVLAETLIYLLRYKLAQKHVPVSIPTLVEELRSIHITQFIFHSKQLPIFKMEKLEGRALRYAVLLHLEVLLKKK